MLKLSASYSKKVPAGEQYSSQSHHCAVEVELPDGLSRDELDRRIHETFDIVKQSVEAELATAEADTVGPAPGRRAYRLPAKGSSKTRPASEKQLAYLLDIAARTGVSPADLEAEAAKRFGVASLNHLGRKDASAMIDRFESNAADGRRGKAA